MQNVKTPRLIANTLPRRGDAAAQSPVRRTLGRAAPQPKPADADERRDPYRIADRTIDHVVDRLMRELTW